MNPYGRAVRAFGQTRAFAAVARRVLPPLDRRFVGRKRTVASFGTGLPVCYLTTRGAKSGKRRTVPLLYGRDGDVFVVAESNWGRHDRPAWACNLDAQPAASLRVGQATYEVHSRRASAGEGARWWPQLLEIWPGWKGYQHRAGREIALYVLEPIPPA